MMGVKVVILLLLTFYPSHLAFIYLLNLINS